MSLTRLYPASYNPQTVCILAKTGFNVGDNDYYLATSAGTYNAYIQSVAIDRQTDFSYVGADRVIRYNGNAEDIIANGADYVAWQNKNFGGMWWYAYIDKVTFINPNRADISVTVDVIATFIYDVKIGNQFCNRIIVPTDGIAEWLDNEDLPCTEYIYDNWFHPPIQDASGNRLDEFCTVLSGTGTGGIHIIGLKYDNVPFSGVIEVFQNSEELWQRLEEYNADETTAVYAVYTAPRFGYGSGSGILNAPKVTRAEFTVPKIVYGGAFTEISPADESAWTANNYKMYTYPFMALYATNNIGDSQYFRYEYFEDQQPKFSCQVTHLYPITPQIFPVDYEGSNGNVDGINSLYGLNLGDMPQVGYSGSGYAAWLGSNATAMKMDMLKSIGGAVFGLASAYFTGGTSLLAGAAVGGATAIGNTVWSQTAKREMASHSAPRNISSSIPSNAGRLIGNDGSYGPTFARATIPQHLAKQYDDYLSLYGYHIGRTWPIDLFGTRRPLFNYYETQNAHISANIPMEYAREIERIFNAGVRFWYDPAKVGDYSDANLKENSLH